MKPKDIYRQHIIEVLKRYKKGITAAHLATKIEMAVAERTVYNTLVKLKNEGRVTLSRKHRCAECGGLRRVYRVR